MLIFLIVFGYILIGLGIIILYEKYGSEEWHDSGDTLAHIFFWPDLVVIFILDWLMRKAGGREL